MTLYEPKPLKKEIKDLLTEIDKKEKQFSRNGVFYFILGYINFLYLLVMCVLYSALWAYICIGPSFVLLMVLSYVMAKENLDRTEFHREREKMEDYEHKER